MNEELFFCEVSDLLQKARQKTYQSINSLIVETYWQIGKRIVEQEQNGKDRANYGEYLITRLSVYLGEQLGKGFSVANLKNFRQFYLVFPKRKSYTLCSQLSWSHIRLIMRLDDENARTYYLNETKEQNWSVRQLERNIKSHYYHRLLSSKTNDQDIGQMDMYVRMFDDLKKGRDDNPTIGLILCADKDETIVKYSILKENQHIFASKYKTVLPSEEELAEELTREKRLMECRTGT